MMEIIDMKYTKPQIMVVKIGVECALLVVSGGKSTEATFGSNDDWKVDPVNADDDMDGNDIPETRAKRFDLWGDE